MLSNVYPCKYCYQRKATETALNRHIAHSAKCFQSWQNDLQRLTSSNTGIGGSINRDHHSVPVDDSDSLRNDSNVDVEMSIRDQTGPAQKKKPVPSLGGSEEPETVDVDEVDDARSWRQYRRAYPTGYTAEILGEGKTKFEMLQDEQNLHGDNEWAPFRNQKEWDLVQWLIRNVGQKSIDEYLKLPIASIFSHIQRIITNLLSDSRACRFIVP